MKEVKRKEKLTVSWSVLRHGGLDAEAHTTLYSALKTRTEQLFGPGVSSMHPRRLNLIPLDGLFAVVKLLPDAAIPSWASGPFVSITRTADELSIVAPNARCLQASDANEAGDVCEWRAKWTSQWSACWLR